MYRKSTYKYLFELKTGQLTGRFNTLRSMMSWPPLTLTYKGYLQVFTSYLIVLLSTFRRLCVPRTTLRFLHETSWRGRQQQRQQKACKMKLFGFLINANGGNLTHDLWQCAAVTTKCSLMRNPPHTWRPSFCTEAMYAIMFSGTFRPFMISLPRAEKTRGGTRRTR